MTQKPIRIVYFSSFTGNTKRFVDKLSFPNERIPLYKKEPFLNVDYDYVLISSTFGDGDNKKIVPMQVKKFLSVKENRDHCVGVIASGNRNFGEFFGKAGKILSEKLQVPLLYLFEMSGSETDITNVKAGLQNNWDQLILNKTLT